MPPFQCDADIVNAKLARIAERGAALQTLVQMNLGPVQTVFHTLLREKGFFFNATKPSENLFAVRSAAVTFSSALARTMQAVGQLRIDAKILRLTGGATLENDIKNLILELFEKSCRNTYPVTVKRKCDNFLYAIESVVIPSILVKDKDVVEKMKIFSTRSFDSETDLQTHLQSVLKQDVQDVTQFNALIRLGHALRDFCHNR